MTLFTPGDILYIKDRSSIFSMAHFAEHRNEILCPCSWKENQARVLKVVGNFVWVTGIQFPEKMTAFYHLDVEIIRPGDIQDDD